MKALLSQCMKYMPVACMKSLMLAQEGWEFDSPAARQIPIWRAEGGFSKNVVDVSIPDIIFGIHMELSHYCPAVWGIQGLTIAPPTPFEIRRGRRLEIRNFAVYSDRCAIRTYRLASVFPGYTAFDMLCTPLGW